MKKEKIDSIIKKCKAVKDSGKPAEKGYNFNPVIGHGSPEIRITPKAIFMSGYIIRKFLDIASENKGYPCSFIIGVKDGKPELIIF